MLESIMSEHDIYPLKPPITYPNSAIIPHREHPSKPEFLPGKPISVKTLSASPQTIDTAYVVGYRLYGQPPTVYVAAAYVNEDRGTKTLRTGVFSTTEILPNDKATAITIGPISNYQEARDNLTVHQLGVPKNQTDPVLYMDDSGELLQAFCYGVYGPQQLPASPEECGLKLSDRRYGLDSPVFIPYQESLVLKHVYNMATGTKPTAEDKPYVTQTVPALDGKYKVGMYSWKGEVRSEDEDEVLSLVVPGSEQPGGKIPETVVGAVFDGMGGHVDGKQAASLGKQTFKQALLAGKTMEEAVQAAHQAVLKYNRDHKAGSGTTIVAVRLNATGKGEIINEGDSIGNTLDPDGTVTQITTDHSLVQRLVDIGRITPEDALTHPRRNVIYRSLGNDDFKNIPIDETSHYFIQLKPGQSIFLACDGLAEMLRHPPAGHQTLTLTDFIRNAMANNNKSTSNQLVALDLKREIARLKKLGYNSPDNISFVLVTNQK